MANSVWLYFRLAGACLRQKAQYRTSFLLLTGGQLFSLLLEFLAILALFQRFRTLHGWKLAEIAIFYGITHGAFAVAEVLGRGFDTFSDMVRLGDFDRFLIRPRSTTLQVAGREFDGRAGRLLQALIVLAWGLVSASIAWSAAKAAILAAMFLGAACIFYGLFVIQAALCFWTVEGLEIMNAVTYGGTETGQYPLTVYRPWFRGIFTFGIPLACVNYLPASLVLDRPAPWGLPAWVLALSPTAGAVFLAASLVIWRAGVRSYCSAGG